MKKANLYFLRSNGEYRLLAKDVDEKLAEALIQQFLDDHDFTSYYTRTWWTDSGKVYDVGSWSEFFLWGEHND